MQRALKGKLVVGLAALAVAAFAGGAYAATESSGPTTRQAFLNDVAKRLHVTPQELTAALDGATQDQLQAAVKAGRLTQAQANGLEQRLKRNGSAPALPFGFFGGPRGPGGPGGPSGPGGGFAGGLQLGGAASYLGLTNAQLFQQLATGKSLAKIATSRGKTVSGLERAMTASMKARLDKLVAAKTITAAEEKQILSRWQTRLAQQVSQKGLQFPKLRAPALRLHGSVPAPPKTPGSSVGPAAQLFAPPAPAA